MPELPSIGAEFILLGAAGLISLVAFCSLILVPALGAYGRNWEKATAAVVSLFVFCALLMLGVALGVVVVYFWEDISSALGTGA